MTFGYVLTGAKNFEEVYRTTKTINANCIKVITGWGLNWNDYIEGNRRALVCSLVPTVVIRTVAGDPSSSGALHPVPELVVAEIEPWYAVKRDIIVEIGNEPNVFSSEQEYIYVYRWYLEQTINQLRTYFPHAKIMSTAMQPDKNVERWYQIFSEPSMNIYDMVDYVGVHAYEHTSFFKPETKHLTKMRNLFNSYAGKLFFTELGINGFNPNKLEEYRQISVSNPVTYYHYNSYGDIDGSYHV